MSDLLNGLKSITITPPTSPVHQAIPLVSSKSESNRALIIDALTGFRCKLINLSNARDTQTMQRLLRSSAQEKNVLDAGTTMRFLAAFYALTGQETLLTGTPRMCERPMGILVEALRKLGAQVFYLDKEGYPPLSTRGFSYSGFNTISLRGDVSSQFISALLMLAPVLPEGVILRLEGNVASRPYIEMTLSLMEHFGVQSEADWRSNNIVVRPQHYIPKEFAVEADWSGASYWYSIVALANDATIELLGLRENSLQGDSAIVEIMKSLGVESAFTDAGVTLKKIKPLPSLTYDFSHCPDLAQTVAVCASAQGIHLTMTGIESLKIKETDRISALQKELRKIGAEMLETEPRKKYEVKKISETTPGSVIDTYDDHRMAMAFAPIGMQQAVTISEPSVVEKSYPSFWEDLGRITTINWNE